MRLWRTRVLWPSLYPTRACGGKLDQFIRAGPTVHPALVAGPPPNAPQEGLVDHRAAPPVQGGRAARKRKRCP